MLICKTIFCPSEVKLIKFLKSLTHLHIYLELIDQNPTILLIGWPGPHQKKIDIHLSLSPIGKRNIKTIYWPINYGKYHLWNEMIKGTIQDLTMTSDDELIWYLDHDIIPDIQSTSIWQKIDSFFQAPNGIVHFNQLEDCRHQNTIYQNREGEIVWTDLPDACASGSFLTKMNIIRDLEPLPKIAVYGLDDYYLALALKNKGYRQVVMEKVFVIHPFNDNEEYQKWKYQTTINTIEKIRCGIESEISEQYYHESIEDSINFWSRQLT
jgi:hypothetical protein